MADVFIVAAESALGFEKLLVLKQLKRELTEEPEFLRMFQNEARLAARLDHPNVVRTVEVQVQQIDQPYIVMEFVEGVSLHQLLHVRRKGAVDIETNHALSIVCDVLAGLAYAHDLSDFDGAPLAIVHRDVSPGNVLLGYSGQVKLADFGIAKAALYSNHTDVGTIKGKASYMAPEQLTGAGLDHRADIFAAGVLLWELVVGTTPWKDALQERGPAPPISQHAKVHPALDAIVARALALDPADRYASARAMLDELETYVEAHSRRVTPHERGKLWAATFAAERSHMGDLVRDGLADLKSGRVRREPPPTLQPLDDLAPEPTSVSLRPEPVVAPTPPRRSWTLPVTLLALAAGGALATFLVTADRGVVAPSSSAGAGVASESREAPAPTATPSQRSVELYVVAVPADASIFLDQQRVSGNPLSRVVPADGSEHELVVTAPGYDDARYVVTYDKDITLRVNLAPRSQPLPALRNSSPAQPEPEASADPWAHP
jgi:serine/threonine-protein kinase